jgi:hypothetical protein
VKDLYNENYKPVKEEIKGNHKKMERSAMLVDWQNQNCENI